MTVTISRGPAMPADNGVNGGANPQISSGYEAIDPATASKTQKKYQERNKRLRPDGLTQYINLGDTDEPSYMHFLKDPWDDGTTASLTLKDNDHLKFLILGAGIGGLLFAVRLIEDAGFQSEEIVIVDAAAGFGGAWYWNRYPGIMCDVESYIYMPLLEETGYMPKHKYAYGEELREQANRIVRQWSLDGPTTSVRADFIMLVPGLLNRPKLPKLPGWGKFQGPTAGQVSGSELHGFTLGLQSHGREPRSARDEQTAG